MVIQLTLRLSTLLTPRSKFPLLADWQQESGLRLLIYPYTSLFLFHMPLSSLSFLTFLAPPLFFCFLFFSCSYFLAYTIYEILQLLLKICLVFVLMFLFYCLFLFTVLQCFSFLLFSLFSILSSSLLSTLYPSCILWF